MFFTADARTGVGAACFARGQNRRARGSNSGGWGTLTEGATTPTEFSFDVPRLSLAPRTFCFTVLFQQLALTNALAVANMIVMLQVAPLDVVMRSLADPTRRAVFERIASGGEITVAELTKGSGVTQSAISQHLRSLKEAELVVDRAQGRNVYYRVEQKGLAPLVNWMSLYGVFWREHFAELRTLLKDIDP